MIIAFEINELAIFIEAVTIGFLNPSYTVNETDGLVHIQIGVTNNGTLQTPVTVNFSISQNQSVSGK